MNRLDWRKEIKKYLSEVISTPSSVASSVAGLRRRLETAVNTTTVDIQKHLKDEVNKALEGLNLGIREGKLSHISSLQLANLNSEAQRLLGVKIAESLELIRFNREDAINRTLQRFMGFASALDGNPTYKTIRRRVKTGTTTVKRTQWEIEKEAERLRIPTGEVRTTKVVPVYGEREVKVVVRSSEQKQFAKIMEPIEKLRSREQMVAIDQGHKLSAMVEEAIAETGQALGFQWRHHYSAHPRAEHESRDGRVYMLKTPDVEHLIRAKVLDSSKINWAKELPSLPGRDINCRCTATYIYTVRELRRRAPDIFL